MAEAPRPSSLAPCALLALLFLAGCAGPSDAEVGQTVLLAAPFVFAISAGFQRVLFTLWRDLHPDLEWGLRASAITFAVLMMGVAYVIAASLSDQPSIRAGEIPSNILIGVAIYGSSYLTILLVTWRVWFAISRRTAFAWSFLLPILITVPPAIPMAMRATSDWQGPLMFVWAVPGYLGAVTAPVYAALLIEVLVRRRRARRSHGAS